MAVAAAIHKKNNATMHGQIIFSKVKKHNDRRVATYSDQISFKTCNVAIQRVEYYYYFSFIFLISAQ